MKSVEFERVNTYNNFVHILIVAATFAIIVLMQMSYAHAADPSTSVTDYYTEVSGSKVYVMNVKRNKYLFLPSEADTSGIQLFSTEDGQTVQFQENGSTHLSLDLSAILPENSYTTSVQVVTDTGLVKNTFTLTIMQGSGAGSLYYNSADPAGCGRTWIDRSKDNRSSGTAIVTDKEGIILNQGSKKQVVEDFHGRGNTSWLDPKKSYQIKFDKKVSLVDGAAEAKKWVLLAQYKDPLRMSDKIIKDIGNEISDRFSPRETWVNFYYDGEYRGLYLLSEKIEVKTGRVDITDMEEYYKSQDETYGENLRLSIASNDYGMSYQYQDGLTGPEKLGGHLLEMNRSSWDDNNGFSAKAGNESFGININSPELGSRESVKYISEYFQEFINAVYGDGYSGKNPDTGLYYYDYCDMDSLVDAYLLQCVSSEYDSFSRSQFFYKDADAKMVAGPVWDMDLSFGTGWSRQESPNINYLASKEFARELIQIPSFRIKVRERYLSVYSDILAKLIGTDGAPGSFLNLYNMISDSLAMDTVIWPTKYKCGNGDMQWDNSVPLEEVLQYRVDWLTKHKAFLDEYFRKMTGDENKAHIYGDAAYESENNHTRECMLHPGEMITEKHCWDSGVLTASASVGVMVKTYTCRLCGAERIGAAGGIGGNTGNSGGSNTGGSSGGNGSAGVGTGDSTENPEQQAQKEAETVSHMISVIDAENPDETAVTEARRAYDALSDEAKSLIAAEEVAKLEAAEKRVQELKEIAEAEAKKEVGAETTVSAGTVTVTSKEEKTVAFTAADKSRKSIAVPATVKIAGDIFKVTEIKTGAFKESNATTVAIGKNVKTIRKKAFAGSKVTKLIIKTRKLTKASVKLSLKGSKVKTVKVKMGTKKLNRKYIKKYKSTFKKDNAGRKVAVS